MPENFQFVVSPRLRWSHQSSILFPSYGTTSSPRCCRSLSNRTHLSQRTWSRASESKTGFHRPSPASSQWALNPWTTTQHMSLHLLPFIMDVKHSTTNMPSSSTSPISIGPKPLPKTAFLNSDQLSSVIDVGALPPGKNTIEHCNNGSHLQTGFGGSMVPFPI